MSAHRHDVQLEEWLRRSTSANADVTPSCLDAETMAAWVEGALSGPALRQVQEHVAGCARCMAVASALAQLPDAGGVVRVDRSVRRWLTWLLPATAAATAVVALAVWVRTPVPASSPAPSITPASTADSQSKDATPATTQQPSDAVSGLSAPAASPKELARSAPVTAGSTGKVEAQSAQKPVESRAEATTTAPTPDTRVRTFTAEPQAAASGTVGDTARNDAATNASAAAPRAEPTPDALKSAAPRAETLSQRAVRDAGAPATPATAPRAAAAPAPAPSRVATWTTMSASGAPLEWRFLDRQVQVSRDSGTTWNPVVPSADAPIRAGSATSSGTCWLVGDAGLVLRATDAGPFARLAFPETVNLTAIAAVDSNSAQVTTADGRRFATTDAGRTWSTK